MTRWRVVVWHSASTTGTTAAIELAGNWVGDVAELLLLLVEVLCVCGSTVLVEPVLSLLDGFEKLIMSLVLRR